MTSKLLIIHFTNCCGGLGDRIVGLVSAVILANFLGRKLKIKHDFPDVSKVFIIPLSCTKADISKDKKTLNTIDDQSKYAHQLSHSNPSKLWSNHSTLMFQCNVDITRWIFSNPHYPKQDNKSRMLHIYRSIFTEYLIPISPPVILAEPSHQNPQNEYIGVQLRTGDRYMKVGPHVMISQNLKSILNVITNYVLNHMANHKIVYFSSDNNSAYRIFVELIRSKRPELTVLTNSIGTGVHFEKSKVSSHNLRELINDIRILANAKILFISEYSNYGRLAVLMNPNLEATFHGFDKITCQLKQIINIETLFAKRAHE